VAVEAARRPRKTGGTASLRSLIWRHQWVRPLLLLLPPMGWFIFIYLAALALLLVTAFWQIDAFTTRRFAGNPAAVMPMVRVGEFAGLPLELLCTAGPVILAKPKSSTFTE